MFKQLTRVTFSIALTASTALAQDFDDLSYQSLENPNAGMEWQPSHLCEWNGKTIHNGYAGANWSGFAALDLRDYLFSGGQTSWGRCFVGGRDHNTGLYAGVGEDESLTGYQKMYGSYNQNATNVVAIGANTARFSRSAPFTLESMLVGAGWGNVSKLTITGRRNGQMVWMRDDFEFLGTGGKVETFGMAGLIDEVEFSATYEGDPYKTVSEQAWLTDAQPYRTFFVDDIRTSTVPEPGTFGLVAAGLAGLVGIARRRRSAK